MARPISLQLYTLREQSVDDFRGVIERVADIGYAAVEPAGLHGMSPDEFRSLVDGLGMRVSSTHVQGRVDGDDLERLADEAAAIGAPYMVVPMGPADRFGDAEAVKRFAERLNGAVPAAHQRGMRLAYHNHWFEFDDAGGRPGLDVLLDSLDPAVVIEVDIYWTKTGGADPAELIARLGPRAPLLHVKDGPCTTPEANMVAVGDGTVDVKAALTASDAVEWHIVELDRFDGDMWDAVRRSYTYLVGGGLSQGTK